MHVYYRAANKEGRLHDVIPPTQEFHLVMEEKDSFTVQFWRSKSVLHGRDGEYDVYAKLSASDCAAIIKELANSIMNDVQLRKAVRQQLSECQSALFTLLLVASGFSPSEE